MSIFYGITDRVFVRDFGMGLFTKNKEHVGVRLWKYSVGYLLAIESQVHGGCNWYKEYDLGRPPRRVVGQRIERTGLFKVGHVVTEYEEMTLQEWLVENVPIAMAAVARHVSEADWESDEIATAVEVLKILETL